MNSPAAVKISNGMSGECCVMAASDVAMAALDGAFDEAVAEKAEGPSSALGGALAALYATGAQDQYSDKAGIFPAEYRRKVLGIDKPDIIGRHFVTYGRIDATRDPWLAGVRSDGTGAVKRQKPNDRLTLTIGRRQCDLVGGVDLALPVWASPGPGVRNRLGIRAVEVTIGGQAMDRWSVRDDMDTQIRASAALFGRSVTTHGGRVFVPLALGPFQNPLPLLDVHEIQVTVRFEPDYLAAVRTGDDLDVPGIELYGDRYWLANGSDTRGVAARDGAGGVLEVMTVQSQYCGAEAVPAVPAGGGGVETRINLSFNHPVQMVYFWGVPGITAARLELNVWKEDVAALDRTRRVCDCPVEALERAKVVRLGAAAAAAFEPLALFFSEDPMGRATKSSINFSRIDRAALVVTTAPGSPGGQLHAVGINQQLLRIGAGMAGLAFSK